MFSWLTLATLRRFAPFIGGGLLLLGLFLLVRCADRAQDKAVETAHGAGRIEQQADDLHETLNRVQEADHAAQTMRNDVTARHEQCVRHSRTPENCS